MVGVSARGADCGGQSASDADLRPCHSSGWTEHTGAGRPQVSRSPSSTSFLAQGCVCLSVSVRACRRGRCRRFVAHGGFRAAGAMPCAFVPPCLKLSCNAWSLGPCAVSRPLCGGDERPDAHIFTCDGLRALCRDTWSAMEWPAEVRHRVLVFCAADIDEMWTQLPATTFDTCWSALVAGSAARASDMEALRARIRLLALRSIVVARVHDHWV